MLANRLVSQGNHLFRFRGVLPLLFVLPIIFSMRDFRYLSNSRMLEAVWMWSCVGISLGGLILRAWIVGYVPKGTSGRNTTEQRASTLNTEGWYSVCRNPLYLGNFLIGAGFIVVSRDLSLLVIYACAFWLYYERIIAAEEAFLSQKFGASYLEWADRTPVFIPAFSQWQHPTARFSWRTVLRREYSAVLLIGTVYFLFNIAEHRLVEKTWSFDTQWLVLLIVCATIFVVLRTLKKTTSVLNVNGRC